MPKTIRNQYEKKLSYEKLMEAHHKAEKGKGYRVEIMIFNLKQEEYILWLYQQLKEKTYRHGGYTAFYITEPKRRKIEKSRYIDRIVHRWVVDNFLEPAFVPQFSYTSYACIKGKGMHKACLSVQEMMKHCKRIWGNYYILKMDIAKYFDSILKSILLCILERKIKDENVMWLLKQILYAQTREKGLEIGNYTSQMFANIYLNEVDQYIKHQLHMKYYCRYMDDSIILVKSKQEAREMLNKIQIFLREKLELELNQKTQIFKNKQGVNFCGYKIRENRLKIREKGKRKLKKKVKKLKEQVKKGEVSSKEARRYLAGHMGYLQIANTENLVQHVFHQEG